MEFSELFELNRLAKERNQELKLNLLQKLRKASINSRFSQEIQMNEFSQLFYQKSENNYETYKDKHQKISIEKDFSYLQPKKNKPRSSLTLSLLQPEEVQQKPLNSQIIIKVYFFYSTQNLNLILPSEIKVADMVKKALTSYTKNFNSALPYGLDINAYQVWLPNEFSNTPDLDFPIPKESKVSSLGIKSLCIIEKTNYTSINSYKSSKIVENLSTKEKLILKVFYKGTWIHIQVNSDSRLLDLLPVIQKKFFIQGRVCEKKYEFRVYIDETGEHCTVDMNLIVKDLRTASVALYSKKFADCPEDGRNLFIKSKNLKSN